MRISDWSSDVCSSDLEPKGAEIKRRLGQAEIVLGRIAKHVRTAAQGFLDHVQRIAEAGIVRRQKAQVQKLEQAGVDVVAAEGGRQARSEEHTSELQSLMRISYAVFCLKKKK